MALLMNLPGITGEGSVQEHIGWHALTASRPRNGRYALRR